MKNLKCYHNHILPIFGWTFYVVGAITFIYPLIALIIGELEFGHDHFMFCGLIIMSAFIGSWGAMLICIGKILNSIKN